MKGYAALSSRYAQTALQYRVQYLLGMGSALALAVAMLLFWRAAFTGHPLVAGYTWAQTRTYLIIGYLAQSLLAFGSEARISQSIREGRIAVDLLQPVDFQGARLAETVGSVAGQGLPTLAVTLALALAFAGVQPPAGVLGALATAVALAVGVVLKFALVYLAALVCFWTTNYVGIAWARAALTNLLSGSLVPLSFFPPGLTAALRWLPFAGIADVPARLYLGQLGGTAALAALALDLGWAVALLLLGRALFGLAVRRVTIHGG